MPIARITAWKPLMVLTLMVLTLMEVDELAYVGVTATALSETFTEQDVSWLHLPIPNLELLDHRFETAWVDLWPGLDLALGRARGYFCIAMLYSAAPASSRR